MIKFIYTADIHFGMENYGKIDPKTGIHSRLLDFEKVFNYCIDHAIKNEVDFFLFSGDAYKTTTPTPTQQKLFLRCMLRLYNAKIPVVIVVGNHDNPLSFGKAHSLDVFSNLPLEGFYVIDKPKTIRLQTKSGPVNIVGIPWATRNTISMSEKHILKNSSEITQYISEAVGNIITSFAQKLDTSIPAVLAAHITVSSGIFSGSEKRAVYGTDPTLLPSQLVIQPFDYVGLGHLHRYQDLNPNGYPAVVYSGSLERIDFGERKEEKGFCLVTIEEKDKTTHKFIKTPIRPFIQIEVKLNEQDSQTEQLLNEIKKHNLEDAIIKIKYHVPKNKKDTVDLQKIQRACSKALYIVSITPIHITQTREKRSDLKVSMNFNKLLGAYLDGKPELKEKKQTLLKKASALYEELEN